jgi:hypothetical protein
MAVEEEAGMEEMILSSRTIEMVTSRKASSTTS